MSNRWNRTLHRRINQKQNQIEQKEQLKHSDWIKKEKLDEIQEELEETPLMRDEEFEKFERQIESINVNE